MSQLARSSDPHTSHAAAADLVASGALRVQHAKGVRNASSSALREALNAR